jgi:PhnB protein
MKLEPHIYLSFNGQCEAAFRFYEQSLNATIANMLTWGNSPVPPDTVPPPGWEEKILHASLRVGETLILGADSLPHQYEPPQGFTVILEMDDPVEAERIFNALAVDAARIVMPMQQTFWAVRFGSLVDRFGIPWSINCEAPAERPA